VAFHSEWSSGDKLVMQVLNFSFLACVVADRRLWYEWWNEKRVEEQGERGGVSMSVHFPEIRV
jgi:hypothetical protein